MTLKILYNIPVFIITVVLLITLYTHDKELVYESVYQKKPIICEKISRNYFKNSCYRNLKNARIIQKEKTYTVNYFLFIWEILGSIVIALFILGRAYHNYFENFIEHSTWGKYIYRYRTFQEDTQFFFFRIPVGIILFIIFYRFTNWIIS